MVLEGEKYSGTGFDHVPGGDDFKNRSALAYHYYCSAFTNESNPFAQKVICDEILGPTMFKSIRDEVKRTGGASILGEFGGG